MNNEQELTVAREDKLSTSAMVLSSNSMQQAMAFAHIMAQGIATVPEHLQGNEADCLAVTMQAMQWGMSPHQVGQKTHLIKGTLGYEAQLVNAVISSSTAIEGRFHYEYGGDWDNQNSQDAWVKVGAILKGEDEIEWGEPLYPSKVTTKNSPLWKTNPKQQASYLALKYWARLYCPAVLLGVYTTDELQDSPQERDITPAKPVSALGNPSSENKTDDTVVETVETEQDALVPTLAEMLDLLKKCGTIDQISAVADDAIKLFVDGTDEYNTFGKAYKAKKAELLRAEDAASASK